MASGHDLTHQSGFVFEAELEQLGASTASGYAASSETAIVRITRILRSPAALAGYGGQRITVHLQPPVSLRVGEQAVFFTHGLHYGDGLVVSELGNVPGSASGVEAEVNGAVQAGGDGEMTQRLAQAELVVSGVAGAPQRYASPQPAAGHRISEHEPDWWTCTVTIETVEKGVHAEKTKDVLYANSVDIAWHRAPKVKAGDHGVFLLHNRDVYGKAVPAHAITHPLDFRPIAEAGRVRSLLKSG
jgi:hypothetical protein